MLELPLGPYKWTWIPLLKLPDTEETLYLAFRQEVASKTGRECDDPLALILLLKDAHAQALLGKDARNVVLSNHNEDRGSALKWSYCYYFASYPRWEKYTPPDNYGSGSFSKYRELADYLGPAIVRDVAALLKL
jgi:hypothetical protein